MMQSKSQKSAFSYKTSNASKLMLDGASACDTSLKTGGNIVYDFSQSELNISQHSIPRHSIKKKLLASIPSNSMLSHQSKNVQVVDLLSDSSDMPQSIDLVHVDQEAVKNVVEELWLELKKSPDETSLNIQEARQLVDIFMIDMDLARVEDKTFSNFIDSI